jgi:single-stranded-DNA-specific exonuclease
VVPLAQNNRILVQQGLQRIRNGQACVGIEALLTVAKRNSARLASSDLGFAVAPRLNAAGRLDDMTVGIECLLTDDPDTAARLAQQLDELNRERRVVEQTMQQDALSIVDNLNVVEDENQLPCIYVLHDETWHQGVVGLVASRIKERTNRPVVALAPGDGEGQWKGSARSVEGVHIRDIFARLDAQHPGLMSKFGGHAMAAGLSIAGDKIPEFAQALATTTEEMTSNKDWSQIIWTDGVLSAADFTIELADQIRLLTPWGQAMPEPLFDGRFEVIEARTVGDIHAKLKLQPEGSNAVIDAICFSYLNDHAGLPEGNVRAVYRLDVNEFRQRQSLQLIVQTIL